jgi:hypothetical protein
MPDLARHGHTPAPVTGERAATRAESAGFHETPYLVRPHSPQRFDPPPRPDTDPHPHQDGLETCASAWPAIGRADSSPRTPAVPGPPHPAFTRPGWIPFTNFTSFDFPRPSQRNGVRDAQPT